MKVVHLGKYYPPAYGGFETHLQVLTSGLARGGVDIQCVVANDGAFRAQENWEGIDIVRLPRYVEVFGTPLYSGIAESLRSAGPDIVHLHWPNPCAVMGYLQSGHRGHLVVTYHSDVMGRYLLQKGFAPFLHTVLNRADIILATSPNYIASSEILSCYTRKCRVVPLGISLKDFQNVDEREVAAIRSRFQKPIVLSVGRLVHYKGFEYLIRSMEHVQGQLLIVGDGPLRNELQNQILQSGIADRAEILSHVKDAAPYYHAADVFVLPSITRAEAFGIVQAEAMATGKPVVNTSLATGVPYVSIDGVTGLTVPAKDAPALAQAINQILADMDLRRRFGNAAQQRAQTSFDARQMVESVLGIYSSLTARA